MNKYLSIFKISFQQEFAYRLNFVMWRLRNVMQIFLVFFLWDSIFASPERVVFGYDRAKILTYIFGLLIIRSIVLSSRSQDIAGEISTGNLTNYLLKPVNYFKYWFSRDISSKALNLGFAVIEAGVLFFLLKPPFFFQTNLALLSFFVVSIILAIILYFFLLVIFSSLTFWYPEQAWGFIFLLNILADFLSGGIFPLDIFPVVIQKILYVTPFPYILFMPLQIYLGKIDVLSAAVSLIIPLIWIGVLALVVNFLWRVGLKAYRAEGR